MISYLTLSHGSYRLGSSKNKVVVNCDEHWDGEREACRRIANPNLGRRNGAGKTSKRK